MLSERALKSSVLENVRVITRLLMLLFVKNLEHGKRQFSKEEGKQGKIGLPPFIRRPTIKHCQETKNSCDRNREKISFCKWNLTVSNDDVRD